MPTFSILILLTISALSFGQTAEVRRMQFNIKKNVAVEGYDPVSYFSGKPAKGKSNIAATTNGITYYFSSVANQNAFKSNPSKYEPAYGGWCAYAMGETGEKVKIDPETYKILDGKLYLFYNFWGTNTFDLWNKNEKPLKSTADQNWKKITH